MEFGADKNGIIHSRTNYKAALVKGICWCWRIEFYGARNQFLISFRTIAYIDSDDIDSDYIDNVEKASNKVDYLIFNLMNRKIQQSW
jgi:hypothetical protein